MARAAVKAKAKAKQPVKAAPRRGRRGHAGGGNPNQALFFNRLRRRAKWVYVLLAVLFAATFAFLGPEYDGVLRENMLGVERADILRRQPVVQLPFADAVYSSEPLARRIEEYDIFWFEEPVAPDDYEGHRKLAEHTSIPIATGENEYTRYGFRDLIEHNAAAILNADAKVLGGVTEFMKVAALAQAHDLDVAPHGSQDIHVHLVAAISNGLILEYYRDSVDPMHGKVYHHTLGINDDGTVSPPDVPGIGVDPNYAELEKYRVRRDAVTADT